MNFSLTQKQKEAIYLATQYYFFLAFGGARSGKTFLFTRAFVIRSLKHRSRHLMVRKYFSDIKRSMMLDTFPSVMESCFPHVPFDLNKQLGIAVFKNGSEIWFGGLDDQKRADKVLGNQYAGILGEELSQFDYGTFLTLRTRLAQKTPLRNIFLGTCNPTTKAHWSYKVFIQHVCAESGIPFDDNLYHHILMNPTDNQDNLPEGYIERNLDSLPKRQKDRFKYGIFADEIEGAIWNIDMIEQNRCKYKSLAELQEAIPLKSIVIGVDPAVSKNTTSDLTGIIAAAQSEDNEYYILEDQSIKDSPKRRAAAIINLYHKYNANYVIVETNNGGDLIASLLRSSGFDGYIKEVRASTGKFSRSEPIACLYEQKRVHHLNVENLRALEDEMISYMPHVSLKSPDRMDAMVWALTYLSEKPSEFFCNNY